MTIDNMAALPALVAAGAARVASFACLGLHGAAFFQDLYTRARRCGVQHEPGTCSGTILWSTMLHLTSHTTTYDYYM